MVPKPFKKYYNGKCSHSTFSMPKAKIITQFRLERESLKAKSNLGTYTYK